MELTTPKTKLSVPTVSLASESDILKNVTNKASVTAKMPFEQHAEKYKCMCGALHVYQGVLIIAATSALSLFFSFITLFFQKEQNWQANIIYFVVLILEGISLVFTFAALKLKKQKLLIPFLFCLIINILCLAVLFVLSIIAAVEPTSFPGNFIYTATFDSFSDFIDEDKKKSQQIVKLLASFMAIFSALLILLDFWWTHTVIKAYRFFVDYQKAKRDNLKMEPEYHAQTFFD